MNGQLPFRPFRVPTYNAHYEGAYDERGLLWRRLGALDKANNLVRLMDGSPVGAVLEFGCGTGAVLAQLARLGVGRRHVGIDVADPGEHRDPGAASLELMRFDGKLLPFEDDAFDLVFASHVIEHVPDPRAALAEMARVAKRWLYVEVPCELHLRSNYADLQRSLDIGHINAYTPESFQLLLESCGLPLRRMGLFDHSLAVHSFSAGRAAGYLKYAVRRTLLAVDAKLASRLFTYHCGAMAQW